MKFFEVVGNYPKNSHLDFGVDLCHNPDPGFLDSDLITENLFREIKDPKHPLHYLLPPVKVSAGQ